MDFEMKKKEVQDTRILEESFRKTPCSISEGYLHFQKGVQGNARRNFWKNHRRNCRKCIKMKCLKEILVESSAGIAEQTLTPAGIPECISEANPERCNKNIN